MASAHHERLDGGGYPHGLADDELTMPMRLLAVADVYEALTSDRPYRRALSSDEALAIMRSDVPERLDREASRRSSACSPTSAAHHADSTSAPTPNAPKRCWTPR